MSQEYSCRAVCLKSVLEALAYLRKKYLTTSDHPLRFDRSTVVEYPINAHKKFKDFMISSLIADQSMQTPIRAMIIYPHERLELAREVMSEGGVGADPFFVHSYDEPYDSDDGVTSFFSLFKREQPLWGQFFVFSIEYNDSLDEERTNFQLIKEIFHIFFHYINPHSGYSVIQKESAMYSNCACEPSLLETQMTLPPSDATEHSSVEILLNYSEYGNLNASTESAHLSLTQEFFDCEKKMMDYVNMKQEAAGYVFATILSLGLRGVQYVIEFAALADEYEKNLSEKDKDSKDFRGAVSCYLARELKVPAPQIREILSQPTIYQKIIDTWHMLGE